MTDVSLMKVQEPGVNRVESVSKSGRNGMLIDECRSGISRTKGSLGSLSVDSVDGQTARVSLSTLGGPNGRDLGLLQSFGLVGDENGSSLIGAAKSSLLTGAVSSPSESVGELTRVVLECLAVAATLGLSIFTRADARA